MYYVLFILVLFILEDLHFCNTNLEGWVSILDQGLEVGLEPGSGFRSRLGGITALLQIR